MAYAICDVSLMLCMLGSWFLTQGRSAASKFSQILAWLGIGSQVTIRSLPAPVDLQITKNPFLQYAVSFNETIFHPARLGPMCPVPSSKDLVLWLAAPDLPSNKQTPYRFIFPSACVVALLIGIGFVIYTTLVYLESKSMRQKTLITHLRDVLGISPSANHGSPDNRLMQALQEKLTFPLTTAELALCSLFLQHADNLTQAAGYDYLYDPSNY